MLETEQKVLVSKLINDGRDSFIDATEFINSDHLDGVPALAWNLAHSIFEDHDAPEKLTWTMLCSRASSLGCLDDLKANSEYFREAAKIKVGDIEFLKACKKILINGMKRDLIKEHQLTEKDLEELPLDASFLEVFSTSEKRISEYISKVSQAEEEDSLVGDGAREYMEHLGTNPRSIAGLSTGFPIYDNVIGGGLQRKDINFIAARPKCGKSSIGVNVGLHMSRRNIPVLFMDSEMSKQRNVNRIIANMTAVPQNAIKTGQYYADPFLRNAVLDASDELSSYPFHYKSIKGMDFDEIIAYIKRWVVKKVGFDSNGITNDAVIVYDYFKLMDAAELKTASETQLLGFKLMKLHDVISKYDLYNLSFGQQNRQGEDSNSSTTVANSDRIVMYSASIGLFQKKTREDVNRDGPQKGNRKLSIRDCRDGEGTGDEHFISYNFQGDINRISEIELTNMFGRKGKNDANEEDDSEIPDL